MSWTQVMMQRPRLLRRFGDVVIDVNEIVMVQNNSVWLRTEGGALKWYGVGGEAADAIRSYFTPASERKHEQSSGTAGTVQESCRCQHSDRSSSEESAEAQERLQDRSCVVTSSPAEGSAGGEDGTGAEEGAREMAEEVGFCGDNVECKVACILEDGVPSGFFLEKEFTPRVFALHQLEETGDIKKTIDDLKSMAVRSPHNYYDCGDQVIFHKGLPHPYNDDKCWEAAKWLDENAERLTLIPGKCTRVRLPNGNICRELLKGYKCLKG